MKIKFLAAALCAMSLTIPALAGNDNQFGKEVEWDATGLIIDGKRVVPAMAEVHYSRIPAEEWAAEVRKMKEGGVTVIATYVFWNHHEEVEGQFDWSGQRDLRRFIEICKEEGMPVVLRMGPFCHGEVRNGGIPDFMFDKGCRLRSEDPVFLDYVSRLYRQIYAQVQDLQWKDGGPIIAAQFENEYCGRGSYLMALKDIALGIGFDLPFYTRTGWPELATPVPYGEMIPLFGDYADGFWERSIKPTAGNYYKAFNFKDYRGTDAIASEQLDPQATPDKEGYEQYPYFTCELGGGMTVAYHRRPYMYPEDAYSMAVVKLGSGSNLLGYYMYHGGTNPDGRLTTLNEHQGTPGTNYNDMMVKSYEFQAPIGEFGQLNPHYYTLRKLHNFMADYGETLAPMKPVFPCPQEIEKGDDSALRWAYRTDGKGAFVFINNYERLQRLTDKKKQRFDVAGVQFPSKAITIPAGTTCIFPVNIDGITYATAQIVAKRDGKIYMEQIPGIKTEIKIGNKVYKNLKPAGPDKPVVDNIYLLTPEEAGLLFLDPLPETEVEHLGFSKERGALGDREIPMGAREVATEPTDADFDAAAIYRIVLPDDREGKLLQISYRGDCARLYSGDRLLDDNFYNGRPFCYGLWRVPKNVKTLELRILPMQANMPVYFPAEADITPGYAVMEITTVAPK